MPKLREHDRDWNWSMHSIDMGVVCFFGWKDSQSPVWCAQILHRSPPLPSQLLSSGFNCVIFMQHSGNLHCDNFVHKKCLGFWLWTLLGLFALLPLDGRDYVTSTQIAYVKTSERNVGSNCANSGLSICLFSAPSNSLRSLTNSLKVWEESEG